MIQSVRMIGGMLGMAIVGTLVTHYYISGVRDAVSHAGSGAWHSMLEDPQVLVNQGVRDHSLAQAHTLGFTSAPFIEAARLSLVAAVHYGLLASLMVALVALFWVSTVPIVRLYRTVVD